MEPHVRDAYETLTTAIDNLLKLTRDPDEEDDDPGLITAWVYEMGADKCRRYLDD